MSQVFSSTLTAATSQTNDPDDHFGTSQCLAPELADLASHIQSWRNHKTHKSQSLPDELRSSIAKLLISGLYSRATLAKQLAISYRQIVNIEANFVHKNPFVNQTDGLNFLPFKLVPHNQPVNHVPNSANSNQVTDNLNTSIADNPPITPLLLENQLKDIVIHKTDGANLVLPINLPPELLYNIIRLFLCSR